MRPLYILVATIVFGVWASAASAGDITFLLTNSHGAPVTDAVVTAYPETPLKTGPIRFDWPQEMDQHNLQFSPFVLIVPAGATVSFPNRDPVRHHVYSFSPAKQFELKLYGREEARTVKFDKTGVVALGCNIHDNMVAFIKVVDTPFAAKSDAMGMAVLHGVPAGATRVQIWHPYLKAVGNELTRAVAVPATGAAHETVQLDVHTAPDRRGGY